MYIYAHAYMHTRIHACINAHICIYMYIHAQTDTHAQYMQHSRLQHCEHTRIDTQQKMQHVCIWWCLCIHVGVYVYMVVREAQGRLLARALGGRLIVSWLRVVYPRLTVRLSHAVCRVSVPPNLQRRSCICRSSCVHPSSCPPFPHPLTDPHG